VENGWYESVSLSDYLGVIWRRKWIVLLVTVMVTAAAVGFSERQQKLFAATSQLVNTSASAAGSSSKGTSGNQWSTSHAPLLDTLRAAQFVVLHDNLKGITPAQLLGETVVTPDASIDAVDFTVTDQNPTTAQKLADAWVTYGERYSTQLDQAGLHSAIAAFSRTISGYQAALTKGIANGTLTKPQQTALTNAIGALEQRRTNAVAALNAPNLSLVTRGAQSATQTQPKTSRNALIGVVLGLILGVILAFLQDLLDTRVRNVSEVGRRLRLPLLASIPTRPRSLRDHAVVLLAPHSAAQMPTAEAFRIVKLNLSSTLRRGMKVIMFTSASDAEGVSTTVANLAVALTRAGQHVVVVDANMRRPSLGSMFGLDDRMGLSDILSGHSQLGDALTVVDVSRDHAIEPSSNGSGMGGGLLEVLPAGPIPGDAAELLDSRSMTDLLRELRGRADVVLVDVPPMLPVTDAMVLGTKVDAAVAVARARLASRPHLVAFGRALEACAAPRLGFIFVGGVPDESQEYGGYLGAAPAPADAVPQPGQSRETELL
jgi:capsular exopolysaccharide synthesis family protein